MYERLEVIVLNQSDSEMSVFLLFAILVSGCFGLMVKVVRVNVWEDRVIQVRRS